MASNGQARAPCALRKHGAQATNTHAPTPPAACPQVQGGPKGQQVGRCSSARGQGSRCSRCVGCGRGRGSQGQLVAPPGAGAAGVGVAGVAKAVGMGAAGVPYTVGAGVAGVLNF